MGREGNPVARLRTFETGEQWLYLWCPGCGLIHTPIVDGKGAWTWDGNLEAPTLSPSILVSYGAGARSCHSFVRNGQWQYLEDCTHELAGQTVDLPPLPDWAIGESDSATE